MENQVLFSDLADESGILSAIERLKKANEDWATQAIAQNKRIGDSQQALTAQLEQYRLQMQAINAKTDSGKSQFAGLKDDVQNAKVSLEGYTTVLNRNLDITKANNAVIDAGQKTLERLRREYEALDTTQKKNVSRGNEIARQMKATTKAISSLTLETEKATKTTQAVEGSYKALQNQTLQLQNTLRNMPGAINPYTLALNKNNVAAVELQQQINRNNQALKSFDAQMGQHTRNVGNYSSALQGLATGGLGGVLESVGPVGVGLAAIVAITGKFISIATNMQQIDAGLKAVSRDSDDFAHSQTFLIALSDKLGTEYGQLAKGYRSLKAATKDTLLEGRETEHIFTSIATAGAKLQLSNEAVEGSLRALSKMVSSGNVQMDELRSELGEHMPGALRILGEALGISQSQLNKMVESGQILAVDVLPKLATGFDKAYGLGKTEQIENVAASTNRLTNETGLLVKVLNEDGKVTSFWAAFIGGATNALRSLRLMVADKAYGELFLRLSNPAAFAVDMLRGGNQDDKTRANNAKEFAAFSQMDAAERQKALKDLYDRLNMESYLGETQLAENTKKLRTLLRREDIRLELKERQDAQRKQVIEEKGAIEKNQTDLTRFQKQAVRKRTAEIIALEKQVAANPNDEVTAKKLEVYRDLDAKQRALDKETSDRLKGQREQTDAQAKAALNRRLADTEAASAKEIAQLDKNKQDGIVTESDYIDQRFDLTMKGIRQREKILSDANQKESTEWKELQAEKLDAQRDFNRDVLKDRLRVSKNNTTEAVNGLTEANSNGELSDRDFAEQRRAELNKGIDERLEIIAEAGLKESQLYKDTEAEKLKVTKDYNRAVLQADKKAWDTQLQELDKALDLTDKKIEERLTKRLSAINREYERAASEVRTSQAGGRISEEQAENRLHNLKLKNIRDVLRATHAALDEELIEIQTQTEIRIQALKLIANDQTKELSERKAAEAEIIRLRLDAEKRIQRIRNGEANADAKSSEDEEQEKSEDREKKAAKSFQKIKQLTEAGLQLTQSIGDAMFDASAQRLNDQLNNLDKQKEAELASVGDNEAAKAAIEKKYDDQKKQLQHQQDVQQKQKATFDAIIGTAVAVVNALPNPITAAIAAALGLAQLAIIQAAPLPQYKEGKNVRELDRYEGPAIAGEAGRELHFSEDGRVNMYTKATRINVGKRDVILSNDLTERFLNDQFAVQANDLLHYPQMSALQYSNAMSRRAAPIVVYSDSSGIEKSIQRGFADFPMQYVEWTPEGVTKAVTTKQAVMQKVKNKHRLFRNR